MEESEDIKNLKDELEDCQQKMYQAAEFGKMLVEQNEELKMHMDELRKSYDRKLELAEQEKYELQGKLDQKCSMIEWYTEEMNHLKQQLSEGQDSLREMLESDKQHEVSRLRRQIDELKADLEQANVVESQLKQKIFELEDLLKERMDQTEAEVGSRSFEGGDSSLLHEEISSLQCEVTNLKSQLIEKKSELSSVSGELDHVRVRLHSRDEELDDIKCQLTSVSNTLEQARVEKLDLKCQLDALRMETNPHRKKGNSIFSELDDRRVDAEKKVRQLQLSNDTLKEKYNVEKQQNIKYKRKISQLLLEMSSGHVDSEYVADLEAKLSAARKELKTVLAEKSRLDEIQKSQMVTTAEADPGPRKESEYTQYLVTLIEGKEQELQKLKQELNLKTLQLLDEKSENSTLNATIKRVDAEKEKFRSQNIKMAAKLEELRMKYEPDAVKKSGVLVVKRTEMIPLDGPDTVSITETSRLHDNSAINQSQCSSQPVEKQQVQPLAEKIENKPERLDRAQKSSFSDFSKAKKVSISDDIEEHEIEKREIDHEAENKPVKKQKGRTLTAVKHISTAQSKPAGDVNECKSQ